jgi:uroporphyrinogen III methyltransferase / synthase
MQARALAVLTRDRVDAQSYARVLAPLGLDVLAMPVTKAASAADPDALQRALDDGNYDAIVVASPRAAYELAKAANQRPGRQLPMVWAVGPSTKRALEIEQLASVHPPNVRDGVELARALVAAQPLAGRRVLVPRAEEGRTDSFEILRSAGAEVVDVVAYRTRAVAPDDPALHSGADALASGSAVVCAVFAPSQVAALGAVMAARGLALGALPVLFCAIGETTAGALRTAGVAAVAVADSPTPEGMARAVGSVYPPKA